MGEEVTPGNSNSSRRCESSGLSLTALGVAGIDLEFHKLRPLDSQ